MDNLPRLRLTLTPCEELVLEMNEVSEGKNFGAVNLLFHILFAFDRTNILENNCQMQIFSKKFVKIYNSGKRLTVYL